MRRYSAGELYKAWPELSLTQLLGCAGFPSCYAFVRGFLDACGDLLLATEFIPGGDLFELVPKLGDPGPKREESVLPVIRSLLRAVVMLHSNGVAHCDISLENAVLRPGGEVVLIDFEFSVVGSACRRTSGVRGKPSYQAPEMHLHASWDAFAADLFACGVSAYCLATGAYPWESTRPGLCRSFADYRRLGLRAFLQEQGLAEGGMSVHLASLLEILLHPDPATRFTITQALSSPPLI